jgi:glycosyltransferase involved in cell wall biosynthesis
MRWVTYFPEIHNVHLSKDVGMLPHYMGMEAGVESSLVGHFPKAAYPALNQELKGLNIHPLGQGAKAVFLEKSFLRYLKAEAKKIDVLQLYHLSRDTIIYGLYYKRHHPEGKLYLKLDAYNTHLSTPKNYSRNKLKNAAMKIAERKFIKALHLVSIENTVGKALASNTYPDWAHKLIYLPNGTNDRYIDTHFAGLPPKENLLLCVSRPGSADKNCELLIAALEHLHLPQGWRIEVVGPCSDEFLKKWRAAKQAFPETSALITFTGEVSDRLALYKRFARAAVFFLPSRFESFGIAYAEALYFGAVLAGHRGMFAYDDLSANGSFGTYYTDNAPQSFANALNEAVLLSQKEGMADAVRKHGRAHFAWSHIVERLVEKLNEPLLNH